MVFQMAQGTASSNGYLIYDTVHYFFNRDASRDM